LITHYKIIGYARKKTIQGDIEYYQQFKFPREIVSVIETNYRKLKDELEKLSTIELDSLSENVVKFLLKKKVKTS